MSVYTPSLYTFVKNWYYYHYVPITSVRPFNVFYFLFPFGRGLWQSSFSTNSVKTERRVTRQKMRRTTTKEPQSNNLKKIEGKWQYGYRRTKRKDFNGSIGNKRKRLRLMETNKLFSLYFNKYPPLLPILFIIPWLILLNKCHTEIYRRRTS